MPSYLYTYLHTEYRDYAHPHERVFPASGSRNAVTRSDHAGGGGESGPIPRTQAGPRALACLAACILDMRAALLSILNSASALPRYRVFYTPRLHCVLYSV